LGVISCIDKVSKIWVVITTVWAGRILMLGIVLVRSNITIGKMMRKNYKARTAYEVSCKLANTSIPTFLVR
jgi:hypothetical protein